MPPSEIYCPKFGTKIARLNHTCWKGSPQIFVTVSCRKPADTKIIPHPDTIATMKSMRGAPATTVTWPSHIIRGTERSIVIVGMNE